MSDTDTRPHRSGFVTLLGRPNAGKSTLINAAMGHKVAITSPTAQTTRHRFRAVITRDDYQLVLVDTPGLHKPHDALGEELNTSASAALDGVDVVAFVVAADAPIGRGDEWVARQVAAAKAQRVLVVNKSDLVDGDTLLRQVQAAGALCDWDGVVCTSALDGTNIDLFIDTIAEFLPAGPNWFPEHMETDQPLEVVVAEFIREKILLSFRDEIPHSIGVVCDEMEYDRRKKLHRVFATVYVEAESQKGIIIGKGGTALRDVGTAARADLEQLLGSRVYLDLHVKVKKNWRRDLNQIRRFGYGEGI